MYVYICISRLNYIVDICEITSGSISKSPICRHKCTLRNIIPCFRSCVYRALCRLYNSPMLTLNIVTVCTGRSCKSRGVCSAYCNSYMRLHMMHYVAYINTTRFARSPQISHANGLPDNAATRLDCIFLNRLKFHLKNRVTVESVKFLSDFSFLHSRSSDEYLHLKLNSDMFYWHRNISLSCQLKYLFI